ncbi:MAG: glycosyltransferase family 1 protein [Candidatus Falkowbacteria bacterium]
MNKSIKRIGIDARFYGPLGKGLGRYTQEIVDNVINIDKDNEFVVFLSKDNFDELLIAPEDIHRVKKVLATPRWYTLQEQLVMPYLILQERLDLMHFPHFNVPILTPVKFIVTIHDLILTKFPTVRASTLHPLIYKVKNLAYRFVISTAMRRAQKIIAVSDFTKDDIVSQFGIVPDKISVIYEGVSNLSKGSDSLFVKKLDDSDTLERLKISGQFILYVGNAYPHKNLEKLLNIFADFHKNNGDIKLVLVGRHDYFYNRLIDLARQLGLYSGKNDYDAVIFPGYVPDVELGVLYKKALFYIFPSSYEGFGLPPLEAMAKACPVLSSNRSSMPEILGDAAYYFNPEDDVDFLKKMNEFKSDELLRQELVARGLKLIKKYNWWECASATLEIYKKVLYGNKKA